MQTINGDALVVLRGMADGEIDAVVTDPPYGTGAWLRPEAGAGRDCRATMEVEEWDHWDTAWLAEGLRVARYTVGFFCPAVAMPKTLPLLEGRSWRLFMWIKPDPRPRFAGQPAYGFEPFVIVGKIWPVNGKDWHLARAPRMEREHPHQKPLDLMRRIIGLCCPEGGTVLDPFMGSGTTGVAALAMGCDFIGIEQSREYIEIARKRLARARVQPSLYISAS